MNLNDKALVEKIVRKVIEKINDRDDHIPVGVSNRHIHLSKVDLESLFGPNYKLTKLKDLRQPGQYAAKETVKVIGPKGVFDKVRILGPTRDLTQLEIALSDGYKLGINPPVRESGKIEDTPGIIIEGPRGRVEKGKGTIAALRHIHMPPQYAEKHGLKDREMVNVLIDGIRKALLYNVLVRVSDKYVLEMHVDIDEANACGLKNGDKVKIIKD